MADAKMLKKVPVREQDPKVRATNFEEVCLGYNQEEAMEEAQRCLGCKKPKCVEGCPVSINIPGFIEHIKEGNMEEAYKVIGLSSALPAICGRVCPQESQCEDSVSAAKKARPFPSASLRDLLLTMLWSMISNLQEQRLRTDIKLQSSVPALQDLPVQVTLQKLVTM